MYDSPPAGYIARPPSTLPTAAAISATVMEARQRRASAVQVVVREPMGGVHQDSKRSTDAPATLDIARHQMARSNFGEIAAVASCRPIGATARLSLAGGFFNNDQLAKSPTE